MMIKPIPIISYHSISDVCTPKFADWRISVDTFRRQMALLDNENFTTLSVSEMVEKARNPGAVICEKTVIVTFDDALCDFYQNAFNILRQYHVKATLYVPTSFVGQTSRWLASSDLADYPVMTWEDIKDVACNGIECGGHSHTHRQLDLLSPEESLNEISRCKYELENNLQRPIHSFAYPHGFYHAEVRRQVIHAGYSNACAVKNAMSFLGDDFYALARIYITPAMSIGDFQSIINGRSFGLALRNERLRNKIWRRVRWIKLHLEK